MTLKRIQVGVPVKYEVLIGDGILTDTGKYIRQFVNPCKALIITDDNVDPLYSETVSNSLSSCGYSVCKYVITSGERAKNIHTVGAILEFSADNLLSESDIFIALGGGVIMDITGVTAALFRSGLRYMMIPTSFWGAVDSSTSGVSFLNLLAGRNLAGARWYPSPVLCDCGTFKTLPVSAFENGIAEAIRLGMVDDLRLFEQFESGSIAFDHKNIVSRCVNIKRRILELSKHECDAIQLLGFGDIFGKAIRKYSDYSVSYANSLAFAMVMASKVAKKRGITRENCSERLLRTFNRHNIDPNIPYDAKLLLHIILYDRKLTDGRIPIILPVRPGMCRRDTVSIDELWQVLQPE